MNQSSETVYLVVAVGLHYTDRLLEYSVPIQTEVDKTLEAPFDKMQCSTTALLNIASNMITE